MRGRDLPLEEKEEGSGNVHVRPTEWFTNSQCSKSAHLILVPFEKQLDHLRGDVDAGPGFDIISGGKS